MGLSIPLNQFDVSVTPAKPAQLLKTEWDPYEAANWSMYDIDAGDGYASALAVEGHNFKLSFWNWKG